MKFCHSLVTWLRGVSLAADQVEALHVENRRLRRELARLLDREDDLQERLLIAHELLLEHSHGDCLKTRGEYR